MNRETLLQVADWIIPRNLFPLLTPYRASDLAFYLKHRSVLRANASLRDRHRGHRCFILCNGPSVKRQDIKPLATETVFSVSHGYHHPDYAIIRPRYHCIPQLTYRTMTRDDAIRWFRELHGSLGDAELFLSTQEYGLVQEEGLFPTRTVHYLCLARHHLPKRPRAIPDLAGMMPRVQTVPVLTLMIALFMGFKEIYLLGVDHDWFISKRYDYFFDRKKMGWQDEGVYDDGTMPTTILSELDQVRTIWGQYAAMKSYAGLVGANIYNATDGGLLDVFPRVRLADVVTGGNGSDGQAVLRP